MSSLAVGDRVIVATMCLGSLAGVVRAIRGGGRFFEVQPDGWEEGSCVGAFPSQVFREGVRGG